MAMTVQDLEEKFEEAFDASTLSTLGGYGPEMTDKWDFWKKFLPEIDKYVAAKIAEAMQKL